MTRTRYQRIILDMDNAESPVYGKQEEPEQGDILCPRTDGPMCVSNATSSFN